MRLHELDRSDPALAGGVAHLYSGGADSSLAACRLAQVFPTVYCNTFDRPGFFAADRFPKAHFERMRLRFPETRFVHNVIPAGRFYAEIEGRDFWRHFRKHGWLVLNTCGHCKVSLHWRNLVFCLQNGIRYASDGAVVGAEEFAEQNPRILMRELEALYAHFKITLLHPSYEDGLSTERELLELGITDQGKIKMTTKDMQVVCTQHILFAMMMRLYLPGRTFEEYERNARAYLRERLEHIQRETGEFLAKPEQDTLVARLLG
ncbi:MAG: hypothetical protein WC728_07925 [Elusimicrobiota bacterium]